jgi:hypothetical protein
MQILPDPTRNHQQFSFNTLLSHFDIHLHRLSNHCPPNLPLSPQLVFGNLHMSTFRYDSGIVRSALSSSIDTSHTLNTNDIRVDTHGGNCSTQDANPSNVCVPNSFLCITSHSIHLNLTPTYIMTSSAKQHSRGAEVLSNFRNPNRRKQRQLERDAAI